MEDPLSQSNIESETADLELPKLHSSKRLQFKNIESLHHLFGKISNDFENVKHIDELGFISNRNKKFQEYKKKYTKTFKVDPTYETYSTYDIDDDDDDDYFLDPITQSLVNEENELMIADLVFRYTDLGTFLYTEQDENDAVNSLNKISKSDIDDIYLSHDFSEESIYEINSSLYFFGNPDFFGTANIPDNPDLGEIPPGSGGGGGGSSPPPPPLNSHTFCNSSTNTNFVISNYGHFTGGIRNTSYIYFGSSRRMKGKIWSTSYGTHSSAGFFTKLQTRTAGIWWASDADRISVSINGHILHPNPNTAINATIPYYEYHFSPDNGGYESLTNTNKAQRHFGFHYDFTFGLLKDPQDMLSFKFAKRVKLKDVASCHYMIRGPLNGEIQFKVSED